MAANEALGDAKDGAKRTAHQASRSGPLRAVARAGFVANGAVHVLIGVIALAIATGGEGQGDQSGAMAQIAQAPLGNVVLWVLAIALWGLALWNVLDGFLEHGEGDAKEQAKKWGRGVGRFGKAVVFAVLGFGAAGIALSGRSSSGDASAQKASGDVLALPGGPIVLGIVGAGVVVGGIAFGVMGVMRSFEKHMSIPSGTAGTAVRALGVVGYLAKGVALLVVGILLIVASVRVDPSQAGGTDAALHALMGTPLGPWAVGAVGVGLIAYGAFCALRGRYEQL